MGRTIKALVNLPPGNYSFSITCQIVVVSANTHEFFVFVFPLSYFTSNSGVNSFERDISARLQNYYIGDL